MTSVSDAVAQRALEEFMNEIARKRQKNIEAEQKRFLIEKERIKRFEEDPDYVPEIIKSEEIIENKVNSGEIPIVIVKKYIPRKIFENDSRRKANLKIMFQNIRKNKTC